MTMSIRYLPHGEGEVCEISVCTQVQELFQLAKYSSQIKIDALLYVKEDV
jgi:hypothetical protein